MTVDSIHDIRVFVCSFICGVFSGMIVDFFRASRRCFDFKKRSVAIQDILTCGIIFSLFTYVVNKENDGDVRWYEFAGAIFGAMLYYCTVSIYLMRSMTWIMNFVKSKTDFCKTIVLKNKKRLANVIGTIKKRAQRFGILKGIKKILPKGCKQKVKS